jgi:hypothetical protein
MIPVKPDLISRFVRIPKQIRYVIASGLGAILLFFAVGVPYPYSWIILPFLCICGYVLTWFALLEDIKRGEWYILFILPVAWTACWYVSFYMVPMRLSIRLLFSLTYPTILYIIFSAMNIFNVGVGKNIQLLRAAQAANQFLNVLVFYLVTQVMSVFGLSWMVLGSLTGLFAGILGIQLFWTLAPSEIISTEVKNLGLFQGFVIGYFMILLSFLPFNLDTPRPMIITGIFYVVSGILSNYKDQILFKQRLREYSAILVLLTIAALVTLRW